MSGLATMHIAKGMCVGSGQLYDVLRQETALLTHMNVILITRLLSSETTKTFATTLVHVLHRPAFEENVNIPS